jgi:purine-cytosine permease-like protein
MGPVGFVRRYVRKFAVYFVVASLAYLAWWAVHGQHVGALWSKPGNGHDAFWPGVDLVLASIVSWTPLAADYTRFARDRRTAFWGVAIGYLLPTVGLFLLGAILMLTRDLGDAAAIPTAVAAGGLASILALLALTVDESDEAFANVYSGAVSLQNAFPRAPQRLLIAGVAAVATAGALVIDLRNYQDFLFLLGSFFVPLFGVLLADWLLAGRHYDADVLFHGPAVRPELIASWLAGFALYQWLAPVGPSWWTSIVEHAHPSSLPFGGASLPSFAAAFLLALAAGSVARRRVVLA